MAKVNEYIDIREFARRTGYTHKYSQRVVHSAEIRPFLKQRKRGAKLQVNWTGYQEYVEIACAVAQ